METFGTISRAQGDLAAARKTYDEALALQKEISASGDMARTRLAMAALSIDEGRPADAEQPARDAAEEFRKEKVGDQEASAYDLLARSLFVREKVGDARKAIDQAVTLSQKIDNRRIRLAVALTGARIAAASNRTGEAEKRLAAVLEDTKRFGHAEYEFEARLALGETEMRAGKAAGRSRLAALERDASTRGFLLIARKANAAQRGQQ